MAPSPGSHFPPTRRTALLSGARLAGDGPSCRKVDGAARDPREADLPDLEKAIADRCLQGETFSVSRRGGPPLVDIRASGKPSLAGLSDDLVVSLNLWLLLDYTPKDWPSSIESVCALGSAICEVAEARGWPEGWHDDPSVIPGLYTRGSAPTAALG